MPVSYCSNLAYEKTSWGMKKYCHRDGARPDPVLPLFNQPDRVCYLLEAKRVSKGGTVH
jgi:hypothetical protein